MDFSTISKSIPNAGIFSQINDPDGMDFSTILKSIPNDSIFSEKINPDGTDPPPMP